MGQPDLRHFQNGLVISDQVEALIGEAWVAAVLCQREDGSQFWATPTLDKLSAVEDWRDATEAGQVAGCDLRKYQARDQGGQKPSTGSSNRVRKSRKKPEAES